MRALRHFFCSIFLTVLQISSLAAQTFSDVVDLVEPSIVSVGGISNGKHKVGRFFGTGFVVSDGRHAVTNAHVVSDNSKLNKNENYAVFMGKGSGARAYTFEIVLKDEAHDLALLKFNGPKSPSLIINTSKRVRIGELYAFTGFPIGSVLGQYPVTHSGMISSTPPIVTPMGNARQLKPEHIKRNRTPFNVYQLDAVAYPGSSGSPLYDPETGQVVGVINSVFVKGTKESVLTDPSGIAYAIPSRHVLNLLKQAGLASQ